MQDPGDIAYRIVKEKGSPMPTRELLQAVLDAMGLFGDERAAKMAEVYTSVALDNRLVANERAWGLREWTPKPRLPRGAARVAAIAPRKLRRESVEEEEEELEEALDEVEEIEEAEVALEEADPEWD